MKRTDIRLIFENKEAYSGNEITVCGWIRTLRSSNAIGFIEINDGSCFKNLQVVFEAEKFENFKEVTTYTVGSAIICKGILKLTPEAKQPFELSATDIELEGLADLSYPLQKKKHSPEFLRTIPHLRGRANTFSAVFRMRSELAFALHSFFRSRGFMYVHTPLITTGDAEGAGEMFRLAPVGGKEFFGQPAYLTVSGQLEGESMAMAFGKIYTFGPTFRAENSNTARHAAEFWMIEPEMAFADLEDDMELAEAMIKYVLNHILTNCKDELEFLNRFYDSELIERLNTVANSEFGRITYTEAVDVLMKHNDEFEYKVFWGCDLATEHERYLTEKIYKKPLFVTDYPKEIKAFYMRLNDDGKTVAAVDALVPGVGEIIGGSQREERLDLLEAKINEVMDNPETYSRYLDLRRYGGTKHAGFGLGFERLLMYVTGISNIRDVLPYPRTAGNAY